MFFDKYLTYNQKVVISIVSSGLWIYFRTTDCYNFIPRLHVFPLLFVMIWVYLNYYEPLFLPAGLLILVLYGKLPHFVNTLNNTKLNIL